MEVLGNGRAWHSLPTDTRQTGRRWSRDGHDGRACPVFADIS